MRQRLSRAVAGGLLLVGVGLAVGLATSTATTRQGVNFEVTTYRIPLYAKGIDFFHRHFQYELLARQITRGLPSDRERVLAVYEWTRRRVRTRPRGFPIVDDHVLDIIIRGYGEADQMADVFTTLSTYAGVPAFWRSVHPPSGRGADLVLAFASIDGRWAVFDVVHGYVFTRADGTLASVEELAADPALVSATAGETRMSERPYAAYLASAVPLEVPRPLRAELQKPWSRLWHEVRRRLNLVRAHEA